MGVSSVTKWRLLTLWLPSMPEMKSQLCCPATLLFSLAMSKLDVIEL